MLQPADLQVISGKLERGEIDSTEYLQQLTRFVAAQIGCSRAGVRVFIDTPHGRALRCVAMYDAAVVPPPLERDPASPKSASPKRAAAALPERLA